MEDKDEPSEERGSSFHRDGCNDHDPEQQKQQVSYRVCDTCHGQGQVKKAPSRKARLRHKRKLDEMGIASGAPSAVNTSTLVPPPVRWEPCAACQSTGLLEETTTSAATTNTTMYDPNLPHVAIVGGGIGGLALAVACRHRRIPHTVYERDQAFTQRRQGYGLTLQQASKALRRFGRTTEEAVWNQDGVISTRHVVHTPDGAVVGEWGLRKWGRSKKKHNSDDDNNNTNHSKPKRQNVHIARQALRYHLLQACDASRICWDSRLVSYQEREGGGVEMTFSNNDATITTKNAADLLVGADGIRSQVRTQLLGDSGNDKGGEEATTATPLRYLGCLVVLGICPLSALDEDIVSTSELLDGATVFQTADGSTRIYMMPYSATEYMWQLSFPMEEDEASQMSAPQTLQNEALARCGAWHSPIREILKATPVSLVSGYPVYDRALLNADQLQQSLSVTLLGDACHPMSPFKGQGANQAMLDALSLANSIYRSYCCQVKDKEDETSVALDLSEALRHFEDEMLSRSAVKVQASAEAAQFLHSDVAIQEGNVTRGAAHKANAVRHENDDDGAKGQWQQHDDRKSH